MFTSQAVHRHDGITDERRSCRRATLQWVVLVFFGGDHWGKLVDLSERGMCFQFEHPPTLRQSINFTFEAMGCMAIPSEGHEGKVFGDAIQATGQVKWTREFERTAGVEFLELSPKSRDQIRYWISSGAPQEGTPASQELPHEWKKKPNKVADRKATPFASTALASATHAPAEPAPHSAKPLFELPEEVFESALERHDSGIDEAWGSENSLAPTTLEEPAAHRRKWPAEPKSESAFAPPDLNEPAVSHRKRAREPEPHLPPTLDEAAAAELREKLDALSHRRTPVEFEPEDSVAAPTFEEPEARPRKWPLEPQPEPGFAPEEHEPLTSDRQSFWGSASALASQGAQSLDFEVPGMLHHDERQRRGQTLELKQRRGRVGFIAVLGFLATLGALAGIIRFTSKFNERAEATEGLPRPLENKTVPGRAQANAVGEASSPFLVEVLDASNRRSVLLFSGESHAHKSGSVAQDAFLPETSAIAIEEPREERKPSAMRQGTSRDFKLIAPHTVTSATGANSALEAPALPISAPGSLEVPLQNLPSPAMPGAPRTPSVGGDVQPARLIRAMLPSYPQIARTSRVAGDVTLDALVDEAGVVRDVKVVSGPLLLREAARQALQQWKYEPARLDGRATAMHLTVTIKFQNNR